MYARPERRRYSKAQGGRSRGTDFFDLTPHSRAQIVSSLANMTIDELMAARDSADRIIRARKVRTQGARKAGSCGEPLR
jgi:hypothetical protein